MAKKLSATPLPDSPDTPRQELPDEMPDFETTLSQIETIVRDLEGGDLSLDESLRRYELAVAKMRQCYQLLEVAERRVSVLAGFDAEGNPVTEALADDSGGVGEDAETLVKKQRTRGQRRGAVSPGRENDGESEEWM